jgi:hypothetical protein
MNLRYGKALLALCVWGVAGCSHPQQEAATPPPQKLKDPAERIQETPFLSQQQKDELIRKQKSGPQQAPPSGDAATKSTDGK